METYFHLLVHSTERVLFSAITALDDGTRRQTKRCLCIEGMGGAMNTLAIKLHFHPSQPLFASTVAAQRCRNMQRLSKRVYISLECLCSGSVWLRGTWTCSFLGLGCESLWFCLYQLWRCLSCLQLYLTKWRSAWVANRTDDQVKRAENKTRR